MTFTPDLTAFVATARADDFPQPTATDAEPWAHCLLPEERALEQWMMALAPFGRAAYTRAAAAAARHAYPIVMERGGEMAIECNFQEGAPSMDGEAAGTQVRLVEAWLAAPSDATLAAVKAGIDPSRQLNVWDEDLYPDPSGMWFWFLEVAHLASFAAASAEAWTEGRREESYTWPAEVCAARAVVCALKAVRAPDGDVAEDARVVGRVIAQAFE
jgi:hypothetical protein